MKNNLFNRYGKSPQQQNSQFQNGNPFVNRFNSMNQFMDQFNQFKQSMTEDPEKKLQQMLNDGSMSQEQYNMLFGLAKKIIGK